MTGGKFLPALRRAKLGGRWLPAILTRASRSPSCSMVTGCRAILQFFSRPRSVEFLSAILTYSINSVFGVTGWKTGESFVPGCVINRITTLTGAIDFFLIAMKNFAAFWTGVHYLSHDFIVPQKHHFRNYFDIALRRITDASRAASGLPKS